MKRQLVLTRENRLDDQPRLRRAAATEFDEFERLVERRNDLRSVRCEQIALDAGEVIFRQAGNRFEQRRAQIIVEVFGHQRIRPQAEARPDVFGKGRHARRMRIAIEREAP